MDKKMTNKISNMKVVQLQQSQYMQPMRLEFDINGVCKYWDFLKVHDSVSILIYNTDRQVLVLVKQFRPSMYACQMKNIAPGVTVDTDSHPLDKGYSLEMCAGIVDKNCSLENVAREEVLEECGYDVPVTSLKKLYSFRGVGITGNLQTMYYVEVTDAQKVSSGGGLASEGEFIEVVEITVAELREYLSSQLILSPGSFIVGAQWFLSNIAPSLS